MPPKSILFLTCLQAEEVSKIIEGRTIVAGRRDEMLDEASSLVGRLIVKKPGCFHRGWDAADNIEITASNEGVFGNDGKWL